LNSSLINGKISLIMGTTDHLKELRRQTAPVICASCYLSGEIFEGNKVCPKTALRIAEFAASWLDGQFKDHPDAEEVDLEVFGKTEDELTTVTTTIGQAKAGLAKGVDELNEKAIECAVRVGSRVIDGVDGLTPTETFTKVEIARLTAPTE
jgi:hypothetical protein